MSRRPLRLGLDEIPWKNLPGFRRQSAGRILFILTIGLLLLHAPDTFAMSKFEYDPAQCRSDAYGKFYVALGPTVLALNQPVAPILIDDIGDLRRVPSDPKQPIGCPDNPMQVKSYEPLIPFALPGQNASPSQPEGVLELTLYDITPADPPPNQTSKEWSAEAIFRRSDELTCSHATKREELPAGLIACRFQQAPTQVHIEDWMATYIAHPDIYQTPLGHEFTFDCQGDLYSDGFGHCHVIYAISSSLGLSYNFEPYRGHVILPIDKVIDYDRALRREVQSSIVEHYPWPSESGRDFPSGEPK